MQRFDGYDCKRQQINKFTLTANAKTNDDDEKGICYISACIQFKDC